MREDDDTLVAFAGANQHADTYQYASAAYGNARSLANANPNTYPDFYPCLLRLLTDVNHSLSKALAKPQGLSHFHCCIVLYNIKYQKIMVTAA